MNDLSKQTILVVDDAAENLAVLDGILRAEYRVQAARNGELALRIANSMPPPNLILLDVVMPGIDGYEVCRRLKENDRTRDIPVIFISALDNVFDKVRGFRTGAVDFITKPFQSEEVLARIRVHLTVRSLQQQLEVRNAQLDQALSRERAKLAERIEAGLRAGNFAWWEIELPSGHIIFDAQKAAMLGYDAAQFKTYGDFAELFHPDDTEKAKEALQNHLEGQVERFEVEYRTRASDGRYRWFRDVGAAAEQEAEVDSKRIIGIMEDITKRKLAEEALLRYIERLRTIRALDGAILAAGTPEHIANVALRFVLRSVPCTGGAVITFDDERQQATLVALNTDVDIDVPNGAHFALQDVVDLQALEQGQVAVVDDISTASVPRLLLEGLEAVGARACLAAPLLVKGELIGVLIRGGGDAGGFYVRTYRYRS